MLQGDKKLTLSIGSDESGNGGLFGGCAFAVFRLNKENLEILKKQKWFNFLMKVMDPKKMDYYWTTFLAQEIKRLFQKDKDFFIWNIKAKKYNQMFDSLVAKTRREKEDKIKSIAHNYIHRQLVDKKKTLKRVLDNFLRDKTWIYYNAPWGVEIVNIDEFCGQGESQYLSISIASILATDAYFEQFREIQMELECSISNKKKHNHNPSPHNIDHVFLDLASKKLCKYDYCKRYHLEAYEKNSKNVFKYIEK